MWPFRKHTDLRNLPNFITIGGQKCGTTSLHYYMRAHPEIGVSRIKETRFFCDPENWQKGLDWYLGLFPKNTKVRIESSPSYTNYPTEQGVPERIHGVIPEVKFVYVVRDPIERAISNYIHEYSNSVEHRPIEVALSDPVNNLYIQRSLYFMQLEQFFRFFDKSRFLIVYSKDLLSKRIETLRTVFQFLGVRSDFQSSEFDIIRHPSAQKRRNTSPGMAIQRLFGDKIFVNLHGYQRHWFKKIFYTLFSQQIVRPTLSPDLRRRLCDIFAEDVRRLGDFSGRSFDHWLEV